MSLDLFSNNDLLSHIFNYLPTPTIYSMFYVSHQWCQILYSLSWTLPLPIIFNDGEIKFKVFNKHGVRPLHLFIGSYSARHIDKIIKCLQVKDNNLVKVCLECNKLSSDDVSGLVNVLKEGENLKELTLCRMGKVTPFFSLINDKLTHLTIVEMRLKPYAHYLVECFRFCRLNSLKLTNASLDDYNLSLILASLTNNPLNYLSLSSNKLGELSAKVLENLLVTLPIYTLDLSDCSLTISAITILAKSFTYSSLRNLNLSWNLIDSAIAKVIANYLKLSPLEVIDLSGNRISEAGVDVLWDALLQVDRDISIAMVWNLAGKSPLISGGKSIYFDRRATINNI